MNNSAIWRSSAPPNFPSFLPADYYLYKTIATPVISASAEVGDMVISVVSSTGVEIGQAVTFYEEANMFQSLVTGKTTTTFSFTSPIDFKYSEGALVEAGDWSMNVDGSVTPGIFSIKAPPKATIKIHSINCSILDATDMDDGKFGGMSALTNGILYRFINGITKNLAVITNNIGFWEIGFSTEYSQKAPAGQYGFRAQRDISGINGTTLILEGECDSEFQMHIRDNLVPLDLFACVIHGFMIDKR